MATRRRRPTARKAIAGAKGARQARDVVGSLRAHPLWYAFGALATYLWLFTGIGSFWRAVGLAAALWAGGVTVWFTYRWRKTGVTIRQAAEDLRAQRKVTRQWEKACEAVGFKAVPPLRKVRSERGDVVAVIAAGKYMVTLDQVTKSLVALSNVIGCREVIAVPIGYTGAVTMRFAWSDPLAKIVKPSDVTVPRKGSAVYGLTDRGQTMALPIVNSRGETVFTPVLIGGVSGSGKSSALWAVLAGFVSMGIPVRLRVIDPAGGVELAALGESFTRHNGTDLFQVHRYTASASGADAMVKEMKAAMHCRLDAMQGKARLHKPTAAEPMDILVVDELLLLGALLKAGIHSDLADVLTVGRKAGFSVIAATQIGEKATLGVLRELFPRRLCFRTNTREQTETILGSGGKADAAPAHRIHDKTQGVGYSYDDSTSSVVKFRAMWLDDVRTGQVAVGEVPSGMENFGRGPERATVHALYRLYSRDRTLLYVGETNDVKRRMDEHAAEKKWWGDVAPGTAGTVVDWFHGDTAREDAKGAEAHAIAHELPRHNKAMNRNNPLRLVVDEVA